MSTWTKRKAKQFLEATFADIEDGEGLVVMPRSLFEFIARNMGVKMPEVPVSIIVTPPKMEFKK